VILAFVLVGVTVASVHLGYETPVWTYCPTEAFGYVRMVKDGIRVARGNATYDQRSETLTAWFPAGRRSDAVVAMTLVMRPNSDLQIHVGGRGTIRMHRGTFCAFAPLPPRTEYYRGEPSSPQSTPQPSPSPSD
jgi:hypothetical protein